MPRTSLFLVTFIIALQAIANLIRFLWNIPVIVGSVVLPAWTGALFFIILGLLATWAFRTLMFYPPSHP